MTMIDFARYKLRAPNGVIHRVIYGDSHTSNITACGKMLDALYVHGSAHTWSAQFTLMPQDEVPTCMVCLIAPLTVNID